MPRSRWRGQTPVAEATTGQRHRLDDACDPVVALDADEVERDPRDDKAAEHGRKHNRPAAERRCDEEDLAEEALKEADPLLENPDT